MKTPTFSGLTVRSFTSPGQIYTLTGECDKSATAVEYSVSGGPFLLLAPGCPNGTFSQPLTLVTGNTEVRVRAQGKLSTSNNAVAQIHIVLPQTSPYQTVVQSSASEASDLLGFGTQNAMGLNLTGDSLSSGMHLFETYLPGVVYGQ